MLQMNDSSQVGKNLVIFAERIVSCKTDGETSEKTYCIKWRDNWLPESAMTVMFPDLLEDFKRAEEEEDIDLLEQEMGDEEEGNEHTEMDDTGESAKNGLNTEQTLNILEDTGPTTQCTLCDKSFPPDRLALHMKAHTQPNTSGYPCTICGKKFAMAQALNWHHMTHVNEKKDAGKTTQPISTPLIKTQLPKQRFILPKPTPEEVRDNLEAQEKTICPVCQKGVLKKSLHIHIEEEHAFPCDCCSIVFQTPEEREKHTETIEEKKKLQLETTRLRRIPSNTEKVKCDICDKVVTKKRLQSHKIVYHFKNGKYPCKVCNKRFLNQRDLDRHSTTHKNDPDNSGGMKVPCDVCHKLLTRRRLEDHKNRFHSVYGENYSCSNCGKRFVHLSDLDNHFLSFCTKPNSPTGPEDVEEVQLDLPVKASEIVLTDRHHTTEEVVTSDTIGTVVETVETSENTVEESAIEIIVAAEVAESNT